MGGGRMGNKYPLLLLALTLSCTSIFAEPTEIEAWYNNGDKTIKDFYTSGDLIFKNDISATNKYISRYFYSTENGNDYKKTIDGNGYSLLGNGYTNAYLSYNMAYNIPEGVNPELTFKNLGKIGDATAGGINYAFSYTDIDGNTVNKNIISAVTEFISSPIQTTYGKVTIQNSVFYNNILTNSWYYNGVVNSQTPIYMSVENTDFIKNYGDQGGAIFVQCEDANISSPLDAGIDTISNSRFIENSSGWNGGAIFIEGNIKNIVNSVFEKNTSKYENGGAIAMNMDYNIGDCNTTIDSSIFTGNTAYQWVELLRREEHYLI